MCVILQDVSAAKICTSLDDMSVTFALRAQVLEAILSPCNDVSVVEEHMQNRSLSSTCKTWGMPLMLGGIYIYLDEHVSQPGALLRVVESITLLCICILGSWRISVMTARS